MKTETIALPFSLFEHPVEENTFALLRFIVELFGIQHARTLVSLLSQKESSNNTSAINTVLVSLLKSRFESLNSLSNHDFVHLITTLYIQADQLISELIETSFSTMQHELSLLDNTTVSSTNLAERILSLKDESRASRLKYETLRQDLLALLLLQLHEKNHETENRKQLKILQDIFEETLYSGKTGEVRLRRFFSVHDCKTNTCLKLFSSQKKAEDYIAEQQSHTLYIKRFDANMRHIPEIGFVFVNSRIKSDFSIIRKLMYKADLVTRNRKQIAIEYDNFFVDTAGFLFVTPNSRRAQLLKKIISELRNKYPEMAIELKHKVGTTGKRGQSERVNFLRVIIYLTKESKPVEIILINRSDYMNYLYEFDQAHVLFDMKKSEASAKLLFPQQVYGFSQVSIEQSRHAKKENIKLELKTEKQI